MAPVKSGMPGRAVGAPVRKRSPRPGLRVRTRAAARIPTSRRSYGPSTQTAATKDTRGGPVTRAPPDRLGAVGTQPGDPGVAGRAGQTRPGVPAATRVVRTRFREVRPRKALPGLRETGGPAGIRPRAARRAWPESPVSRSQPVLHRPVLFAKPDSHTGAPEAPATTPAGAARFRELLPPEAIPGLRETGLFPGRRRRVPARARFREVEPPEAITGLRETRVLPGQRRRVPARAGFRELLPPKACTGLRETRVVPGQRRRVPARGRVSRSGAPRSHPWTSRNQGAPRAEETDSGKGRVSRTVAPRSLHWTSRNQGAPRAAETGPGKGPVSRTKARAESSLHFAKPGAPQASLPRPPDGPGPQARFREVNLSWTLPCSSRNRTPIPGPLRRRQRHRPAKPGFANCCPQRPALDFAKPGCSPG